MFRVHDRLQFTDRQFATVRYVGHIKEWGDEIALGIEWDDPKRGKNDGSVGGIEYFTTTQKGAGSFIKLNNKKLLGFKSFEESIIENYGIDANELDEHIQIGTKEVESYGFEKLNRMNSDFGKLSSITLDFKCINRGLENSALAKSLTGLKKLDLGFNLFRNIDDVWKIIDSIPNLTDLNLNGNRFQQFGTNETLHNLKVLKLSNTQIPLKALKEHILPKFPQLQELTLASNGYSDDDVKGLPRFQYLDLSFNSLTTVPSLLCDNINLTDNSISSVMGNFEFKAMDIRHNQIDSWEFIDRLSMESHLRELRINENPLFSSMNEEDIMVNLIARFNCNKDSGLHKIDGSSITEEEIVNAELYFVSMVQKGEFYMDKSSDRWAYLKQKYSIQDQSETAHLNNFASKKIKVKVFHKGQILLDRFFLSECSVLRLKGSISRVLNQPILSFKIFHLINEQIQEYLDDETSRIGDLLTETEEIIYIA